LAIPRTGGIFVGKAIVLAVLAGLLVPGRPSAAAQGQSDIFVAAIERDGRAVRLGPHVNVTRRAGYDNQPHFARDGGSILYTRIDETGQADIWRYDIGSTTAHQVTHTTPESEYSATPLAAGGFTVIRVERDSTQRLWHFDDDGSNPRVVFEDVKPVGYHAWADDVHAAMFILGQPPTLQLGDRETGVAQVIATGIGRAIQKVPGRRAISFLHMLPAPEGQPSVAGWMLKVLDVETGSLSEIARPPFYTDTAGSGVVVRAADYHAWLPDGTLITAAGSRFYAWDADAGSWDVITDVASDGLLISRLAVSPDGARLAFVAEPADR
jgi:hypothetical protein